VVEGAERKRVVIARRLPAAGRELLEGRLEVDQGTLELNEQELGRRVAGAFALIADPTVPVGAQLLDDAGPSLKIVSNFAVGHDNVDLTACHERGIAVTNTPDVLTNATAELTLALMLACARRLGEAERAVRDGRWRGWDPEWMLGSELADSTIGIVGPGRIGSRVAELLRGFGARLLYASRSPLPELERRLVAERRALEQLVAESDFVTFHVPLRDDTRHLVDRSLLARFKPGSTLINTTRGPVVDTDALIAALREGPLGAAGLDVYEHEPDVPAALLELENVVLLPHLGSATRRTRDAMAALAARNVLAVLDGGEPPARVT
jgi:glyoxylate reductase